MNLANLLFGAVIYAGAATFVAGYALGKLAGRR